MSTPNTSNEPPDFEPSTGTQFNTLDHLRKMQEEYRLADTRNNQPEVSSSGRVRLFKAGCFLAIFIVVVGFIGLAVIARREQQERAVKQVNNEKVVRDLAGKYDAILDWRKSIEGRDELFSSEVLEALSGNKRPVLLKSIYIKDVSRKEGKYVAKVYEVGQDSPDMYFILECTDTQGKRITEDRYRDSEFTVIASINDVRKSTKEDVEANDDEMDYLASGTCLEIIPMD